MRVVRPMGADASAPGAADGRANFLARRHRAGTQQHGDWAGGGGVIDVDRQKAPRVVMRVEQRELLMPVHDIDGVIDVQRDRAQAAPR